MKLNKENKPKISIKMIISLVAVFFILFITVISFSNKGRVDFLENGSEIGIINSVGRHLNNVVTGVGGFFGKIVHFNYNANKVKELTSENQKLKEEIIQLKSNDSKFDDLERLKKSLNYVQGNQRNQLVSSRVIGKNDGNWYKSFIIDAGAGSGIKKDSIVINGDGVVGIVYSVSNKFSKAISLVDTRASVSFKVQGDENIKGVITTSSITGNGKLLETKKRLSGYLFEPKSQIKEGDLLVTSGLGLYPENIPIAKVINVKYDKNKSMKLINAEPVVDFKNINEVSIIPPRNFD